MRQAERRSTSASAVDGKQYFKRSATSSSAAALYGLGAAASNPNKTALFGGDDLVSAVIPAVTVVLEGRSICQRVSLHKHGSYQSLARALQQMFVDSNSNSNPNPNPEDGVLDLSNAVPGHLIAYEDMENDLLLVGDLNWKDFVRVAKRIRILPVKPRSRKMKRG